MKPLSAHFSATVTPRDWWTVHVQSQISRTELIHHLTIESRGTGIRVDLRDGLFLLIDNDKVEIWRSTVRHGDYVDDHITTINLNDYRQQP